MLQGILANIGRILSDEWLGAWPKEALPKTENTRHAIPFRPSSFVGVLA
jgi:hypothetical protein